MNVLFICTGNTCRSPMAKYLFLQKYGSQHQADSCGFAAFPGELISQNSLEALREVGIDASNHRSRLLNIFEVDDYDILAVFSPAAKQALCNVLSKEQGEKVYLLGGGIADPYGGDMDVYRACRDQIEKALEELVSYGNSKGFDN